MKIVYHHIGHVCGHSGGSSGMLQLYWKKKVGVLHLFGKGRCVVAAAIGHKVHQAELVRPLYCSTTLIYGSNRQEGYAAIFFVAEKMIAGSHHHIVGAAYKIVIIKVL